MLICWRNNITPREPYRAGFISIIPCFILPDASSVLGTNTESFIPHIWRCMVDLWYMILNFVMNLFSSKHVVCGSFSWRQIEVSSVSFSNKNLLTLSLISITLKWREEEKNVLSLLGFKIKHCSFWLYQALTLMDKLLVISTNDNWLHIALQTTLKRLVAFTQIITSSYVATLIQKESCWLLLDTTGRLVLLITQQDVSWSNGKVLISTSPVNKFVLWFMFRFWFGSWKITMFIVEKVMLIMSQISVLDQTQHCLRLLPLTELWRYGMQPRYYLYLPLQILGWMNLSVSLLLGCNGSKVAISTDSNHQDIHSLVLWFFVLGSHYFFCFLC